MVNAEELAVAMVIIADNEIFIVGHKSDVQRLNAGSFVGRAWDIKLDNGHRPYAAVKKRIDYDITEQPDEGSKNSITAIITAKTGVNFAHNLHLVIRTWLLRETAAFWSDLWVDFADDTAKPQGIEGKEFFALYRGAILPKSNSVKFIRL